MLCIGRINRWLGEHRALGRLWRLNEEIWGLRVAMRHGMCSQDVWILSKLAKYMKRMA